MRVLQAPPEIPKDVGEEEWSARQRPPKSNAVASLGQSSAPLTDAVLPARFRTGDLRLEKPLLLTPRRLPLPLSYGSVCGRLGGSPVLRSLPHRHDGYDEPRLTRGRSYDAVPTVAGPLTSQGVGLRSSCVNQERRSFKPRASSNLAGSTRVLGSPPTYSTLVPTPGLTPMIHKPRRLRNLRMVILPFDIQGTAATS